MNKISIVIAEDNELHLEGLIKVIQQDSSLEIVGVARNGIEVINLAHHHQPDVILMDISMPATPEVDGIEATKRIKKVSASSKVLVISGHDENVFRIISAGARGFLHKDNWSSQEGLQAIHTIANGGVIFNSKVANRILKAFTNPVSDLPQSSLELDNLTDREMEILEIMVSEGITENRSIANRLNEKDNDTRNVTHKTVATHLTNILKKLELVDRAHLMWRALKAEEKKAIDEHMLVELVLLACNPPGGLLRKSWNPAQLIEEAHAKNIFDEELAEKLVNILNTHDVKNMS